ncbi:hypothetical protein B566_EDAN012353, partial [Ephemera danica]
MGLRGPSCCSMTAVCFLLLSLVDVSFSDPIVPPPLKHTPQASSCQLTRDSGTCTSWIAKWYYDAAGEQCNTFYYGSCGGNDNRYSREIRLWFRTRMPHGLLAYHGVKRPSGLPPYALFVLLQKGQLRVKHVIGENTTILNVG